MKKILTLSLLTTSILFANSIDSIGVNLSKLNTPFSKKDHSGSIILGNEPKESFNSIEIFTILNKEIYGMKPYISYTYSKNTDLKHQYILTGLNKYYKVNKFDLYAGVLLGYGDLNWRYDPLNSSSSKNVDANSFIGGVQVGFDYPISNKYTLGLNGKYLVHDYETKLEPSTGVSSTIEHDRTYGIGVSVSYKF